MRGTPNRPVTGPSPKRLVMEDLSLEGSKFSRVNMSHTMVMNSNLSGLVLDDVNLSGMSLHNVNLSGSRLENVNLSNSDYKNANFVNVTLEDCFLDGMTINGILVTDLLSKWEEDA